MPVVTPARWINERKALLQEMRQSILSATSRPVNLSLPRHSITGPCLRSIAYDRTLQGKSLPIVFKDHSRPPSFPAGLFEEPPNPVREKQTPRLRIGLMSFRHPELDYLVDMYVCRNLEIVHKLAVAEAEAYAYQRSLEMISQPDLSGLIEVFHTGLEPVVIGFYRGVADGLMRRKSQKMKELVIRAKLFAGEATRDNLGPKSPGALAENYVSGPDWH